MEVNTSEQNTKKCFTQIDSDCNIDNTPCLKSFSSSFEVIQSDGKARTGKLFLRSGVVETPSFMPVGTKGAMKMIPSERLVKLGPKLILSNTYHLGFILGKEKLNNFGGIQKMMNWPNCMLTDSGGFQMVSLCSLSSITEEGVHFSYPGSDEKLFLTPEESITIQNSIGADIMMALDDVISVVNPDRSRFVEATDRTTRWLDRCISANRNLTTQKLWAIVQGGLYEDLRLKSLKDLKERDLSGYAIGGLSGGEMKKDFWKMVNLCTNHSDHALPFNKPRYLMGVGYPLDLVVCTALGVDLFDCVFPTRTARFGVALTDKGQLKLKSSVYKHDEKFIDSECDCYACKHFTRSFFNKVLPFSASANAALSEHNLRYMHNLGERMRNSIKNKTFKEFVKNFLHVQFPDYPPIWVREALRDGAGIIEIEDWYDWSKLTREMLAELADKERCGFIPHTDFKPHNIKKSRKKCEKIMKKIN